MNDIYEQTNKFDAFVKYVLEWHNNEQHGISNWPYRQSNINFLLHIENNIVKQ